MTDDRPPRNPPLPPLGPPPLPRLDGYRPQPEDHAAPRPPLPHPHPHAQPNPPPLPQRPIQGPIQQPARHPGQPPPRNPAPKFPPRPLPPGAAPHGGHPRRTDVHARRDGDDDEGRSVLAYVGFALVGLLLIAAAAIGYLMLNPPVERIRSEVIAQVKAKTGRDLTIGGPARFTIYPALGVTMDAVELSAAPGMAGKPLVTMAGLDVSLELLPLLSRRVAVERLVLRDPVIELRTDTSGRKSWDMRRTADAADFTPRRIELAQAATPGRATDAAPAGSRTNANPLAGIEQITLQDVRIHNGTIVWHDERTGVREALTAVNLTTAMHGLASPLDVNGSFVVRGERLDVTGSLTSLKTMLDERPAKLTLKATNRLGALGFDGALAANADANGVVTLKAPSVRDLARLVGVELPPGAGFGAASVTGKLKSSGASTALDEAVLVLDAITATGSIGLDGGGARPLVKANLQMAELDLNPYLMPGAGSSPPPPAPAAARLAPTPPAAAGENAPASIDDLLSRPPPEAGGPRVKGFTQRAGWSEQPIQLAALGAIDADVKLQIGKVLYQRFEIGQSRLSSALRSGVVKTVVDDVQLYQGRGRGSVTLDGTSGTPRVALDITADGVAMGPLVKAAAGTGWLSGSTKLAVSVTGTGGSQKALMDSLAGKADMIVSNGAIVGWNVAQIIRGLKQGQLASFERNEAVKTDFSELSGTWNIAGGVAQNQDLKLNSPLLRVTGAGRVAIGARQIDYQLKPKLVASLDGQGAAASQGLAGLEIPLRVRGPWEHPEVVPELGGVLNDPDKALGAVKDLGKQLKGKNPNEIVDHVLGNNPKAAKKANDLLNKFLKPKAEPAPAQ